MIPRPNNLLQNFRARSDLSTGIPNQTMLAAGLFRDVLIFCLFWWIVSALFVSDERAEVF